MTHRRTPSAGLRRIPALILSGIGLLAWLTLVALLVVLVAITALLAPLLGPTRARRSTEGHTGRIIEGSYRIIETSHRHLERDGPPEDRSP